MHALPFPLTVRESCFERVRPSAGDMFIGFELFLGRGDAERVVVLKDAGIFRGSSVEQQIHSVFHSMVDKRRLLAE